ncbi:MAG: hypothetical protein IT508_08880 [Burkholderiaceae bacterium]|nr:hypothetical protein [Burkholderiaceae bacterium]
MAASVLSDCGRMPGSEEHAERIDAPSNAIRVVRLRASSAVVASVPVRSDATAFE